MLYLSRVDGFLFIRHGHDSKHQVEKVEGTKENNYQEEQNVPGTAGSYQLK
jgi:hypothetical protein